MATGTDVGVLGSVRLGSQPQSLGTKQRRLITVLAVDANRSVSTDRIVAALWGDDVSAGANATLHSHISRLRRHLLGAGCSAVVTTVTNGYCLEIEPERLDALLFERLLSAARSARKGRDRAAGIETLRRALALWRGPAYEDVSSEAFAQAEAVRLEELRIGAREDLADALVADGRHDEAVGDIEALVQQHPYRERLWSAVMLARYRSGRQAEALEAYHRYRSLLDEDLGLSPSAALQRLHRDMLAQAEYLTSPLTPSTAVPLPAADEASAHRVVGLARDRIAVEGPSPAVVERKLVTVLVAELALGAEVGDEDPDDLAERLEPALAVLLDVARRFGGTVAHIGTADITALFGAPVAVEDHAVRACRAAQAMLHETHGLRAGAGLTVGCHSGHVLLRHLGRDSSSDTSAATSYDAVGPAVERAREASRAAPPSSAILSSETLHLAQGIVAVEPVGAASDAPAQAWWRLRDVAATTTWEVRSRLGLNELVGRERHLAELQDRVAEVASGAGRAVAIVGDPGVGKSRLVYELLRRVPATWTVAATAATPLDAAAALHPLRAVLRQLLGITHDSSAETASAALQTVTARGGEGTSRAALSDLLGLPDESGWRRLDPGIRRRRTIRALTNLTLEAATLRPVLLVVEDAHWLDGETQAVLAALVDRLESTRLLLVITYRPEHDHGWGNRSPVSVLRVDPLTAEHAHALVRMLLGDHHSVRAVSEHLARWTGGVPLFLEESVRALVDNGTLLGETGKLEMRVPTTTLRLPPRVHGVLAARIDRLSPPQKGLLQTAAVIGPEGPLSLLVDVLHADVEDIDDDLAGIHRAELLYERRHEQERYFAFKHAIVHDAAYASLPRAHRRVWHARVVEAIRSRYGGQLDDHVVRLAHHAMLAERWQDAVELNSRAGELALQRCAYREAAALLERAIVAQQRLPADAAREVDLSLQLRPALHALGEFDRMLVHLDRAESLATAADDERRQLLVAMHRSYLLDTRGHVPDAIAAAERAATLAVRIGEPLLIAEARLAMAQCLTFAGDPRRVGPLLEQDHAVRSAAPLDERLGMAGTRPLFALVWMSMANAVLGNFDAAAQQLDAADRIAAEVERPIDTAVAGLGRGVLLLRRGRSHEASVALGAAYEVCEDAGMPLIGRWVEPVLAEALAVTGRATQARGLLERTAQAGEAHGVPLWQASAALGYARAALADGDASAARPAVARAIALAATWNYRETHAVALRLEASAAALAGDIEHAVAQVRRAAATAHAIGARPEHARCELVLAELLRGTADTTTARLHADAALDECERLGLADPLRDRLAEWRGRSPEGADAGGERLVR